jgi:hypothetical protein
MAAGVGGGWGGGADSYIGLFLLSDLFNLLTGKSKHLRLYALMNTRVTVLTKHVTGEVSTGNKTQPDGASPPQHGLGCTIKLTSTSHVQR